jgi:hypothetical protein
MEPKPATRGAIMAMTPATRADETACLDVIERRADDATLREHLLGGLRGFFFRPMMICC